MWLGIKVGTDAEMTPRQPILPVPYALGLRPGALVSGTVNSQPILQAYNSGSAAGLYGEGALGVGVYGKSTADAAVYADGSIKSSSKSYLWISGNHLRASTSAEQVYSLNGAARVEAPYTYSSYALYLPITIPGVLYGQNVSVKSVRVYYKVDGNVEFLVPCYLDRWSQGTGTWVRMGENIDYNDSTTPDYFDVPVTQNGTLSANDGILSLLIGMSTGDNPGEAIIYGARVELAHQ